MQRLLNFDVSIQPRNGGYQMRVVASPAGEAYADFALPFTDQDLEILVLKVLGSVGRARRKARRIESHERRLLEDFGGQLFQAAFSGPIRDRLDQSLAMAESEDAGLRIRLRLPPALANIPWEYLYDRESGGFVSLSPETALVRYVEMPRPARPFPVSPPLRILAMISAPNDVPELQGDDEWDKLNTALSDLTDQGMVQVNRLEAGTLSALQRPLRQREYHVLHFVGHGVYDEDAQDGALALEGESGSTRLVTGRDLGMMLKGSRSLRLVVLNACEGARSARDDPFGGVAQALVRQGIPAVIAMQFEISDPAALVFSQSFYQGIADDLPVDVAMVEARKAMFAAGHEVEWATPVLYLRSPDGRVFTRTRAWDAGRQAQEDAERQVREDPEPQVRGDAERQAPQEAERQARDKAEWQALVERARMAEQAGDAAGARNQFAALMSIQERMVGPEHPDTLATRQKLAYWTGKSGDAAGARNQFAALLPIRERVLGAEHPDTLATRASLAYWTGESGDAAGARDQYVALLPIRERVLGPEYPDALATRDNLAYWTGRAGDAAGARAQYAALLPIRERVLGPGHPDTLTTRDNLAYWTRMTGQQAREDAELQAGEQVGSKVGKRALRRREDQAHRTARTGDAAGARDQFAAVLQIGERVQGPDHPDTLATRDNLAYWTGVAGDAARARDLYAALLQIRERVQGPNHPDTLATRDNLASWTGAAGDAARARDLYTALLQIRGRVLGPKHPDTLKTRAQLAYWTRKAEDDADGMN
jgi:hypothetical protein